MMINSENKVIDVDDEILNKIDIIESLCLRCGKNGITRLIIHKVPYFRELIIASFQCEECGEYNNEVTFGGEIQLQGCKYHLNLTNLADLDRQLIKSDTATIRIPSLDFEIPPMTQKGEISTIEGFIKVAVKNLSLYQEERMKQTPEIGLKVQEIINVLEEMATGNRFPFEIELDDPSGNSFIQNPYVPNKDPNMRVGFYYRTPQQDMELGLNPEKGIYRDDKDSNFKSLITGPGFGTARSNTVAIPVEEEIKTKEEESDAYSSHIEETDTTVKLGRSEVVSIPSPCPNCGVQGFSQTALTDIPHFKEIIIMAFDCSECGYKNSEIRGGGAIPTFGTEVQLRVTTVDDLKRDVLKSDSALIRLPELELELSHGTLGGLYTTVEGLLLKIARNLGELNPFVSGDSTRLHHSSSNEMSETQMKFSQFIDSLGAYARGEKLPFTLIFRDPLGNSFVSAPLGSFLPPESDPGLTICDFTRSFEENEEFGLNDMDTKNFEIGVHYDDVILSDRITQKTRRITDHPTFFAKGTEDSTPGGAFIRNDGQESLKNITKEKYLDNITNDETREENIEPWYSNETLPLGWVALKPGQHQDSSSILGIIPEEDESEIEIKSKENMKSTVQQESLTHKRVFSEEDKNLKFEAREEFSGRREGYVYRLGFLGLGYYEDKFGAVLDKITNLKMKS